MREKYWWSAASCAHPTRDQAWNQACALTEMELATLAYQDDAPTNWATQPGQCLVNFLSAHLSANSVLAILWKVAPLLPIILLTITHISVVVLLHSYHNFVECLLFPWLEGKFYGQGPDLGYCVPNVVFCVEELNTYWRNVWGGDPLLCVLPPPPKIRCADLSGCWIC